MDNQPPEKKPHWTKDPQKLEEAKKKGFGKGKKSGVPEQKLSPWQQAEQEAQKKEQEFKNALDAVFKDTEKFETWPDLHMNAMIQHPITRKAVFDALLQGVHLGRRVNEKLINRVIDQLVGRPMQQVQLSNGPDGSMKTIIGQLSQEQLVQIAIGSPEPKPIPASPLNIKPILPESLKPEGEK